MPNSAASGENLAVANGLSHHFGTGDNRTQILHDIAVTIPPGQLVIMTGPSGSGKTTLLTLFGALRSNQAGTLQVLGQDLRTLGEKDLIDLRRSVGFIFQLHNLLESLTAIDNVMMAAQLRWSRVDARERSARLLERVGLGQRLNHKPGALSGGQRQRVAVARALVNAPRLILADEPTAALDGKSTSDVLDLLQEHIAENASSCLMVTHDNRILDRADRIINLVDGRVVSDVMVKEQAIVCDMLSKIPFFADLGAEALRQVSTKLRMRRFADGDVVIRQGDVGEEFFLVRHGDVKVHVSRDQESSVVATLTEGQYFGERALITGDVRNATIVADGQVGTYVLDKDTFNAALAQVPSLQDQIRANIYRQ